MNISIELPKESILFKTEDEWEKFKLDNTDDESGVFGAPIKFPCYGFSDFEDYHPHTDREYKLYSFLYPTLDSNSFKENDLVHLIDDNVIRKTNIYRIGRIDGDIAYLEGSWDPVHINKLIKH